MSRPRSPKRGVIAHDARLDILCGLDAAEPMDIAHVSSAIGMHPMRATHHLRILDAFGLVEKKYEGGRMLYATRLEEQPGWIEEAVNDHRQGATGSPTEEQGKDG
jgi:DNA-binding transcriptional ArsR family regulator